MLAEMISVHGQKTEVFKANQEVRQLELEALNKAIEIISSPNVADSYAGHINLAQKPSFLQTQSTSERVLLKQRASELLRKRARALSSRVLATAATEMAANPFAKVVEMIKSLLAKLKEEAAAEADHKAWCDKELKENKLKRNKKTAQSEKYMAQIEELNAQVAKLTQGINDHEKAMGEIDAAMAEATEVRQKEKAKNEETIADCEAAIEAVSSALTILKEFYKKAAGDSLLQSKQTPADDAPASFSNDAYTGQQGSKRGVIDMLDVIHADFSRLLSDTTTDESESAREYESFMDESAKDRETKRLDQLRMTRERTAINGPYGSLGSATKDLKATQAELDAALAYYDKLKPDCIAEGLSFAERAQRRQEEIDSLNEAYKILNGEAVDAE